MSVCKSISYGSGKSGTYYPNFFLWAKPFRKGSHKKIRWNCIARMLNIEPNVANALLSEIVIAGSNTHTIC